MLRRRGPVPYELISRTRGLEPARGRSSGDDLPIGPGRSVRVPVGYLLLGLAVAIGIGVMAFTWGFSRGRDETRTELAKTLEQAVVGRSVQDPLGTTAPGEGSASAIDAVAPSVPVAPAPGGDPRQPGLNYFVIAHATPETAPALAAFCREQGLEASVVSDHNGVLRKVIVTPGYADGARRSDEVQALERRIREVGLRWKSSRRGNADFSGAYPELFRGAAASSR